MLENYEKYEVTTSPDDTKSGWIAPSGELVVADVIRYGVTHAHVAEDLMTEFYGADYSNLEGYEKRLEIQHDLSLKGWVRLDWQVSQLPLRPTMAQITYLEAMQKNVWKAMVLKPHVRYCSICRELDK